MLRIPMKSKQPKIQSDSKTRSLKSSQIYMIMSHHKAIHQAKYQRLKIKNLIRNLRKEAIMTVNILSIAVLISLILK